MLSETTGFSSVFVINSQVDSDVFDSCYSTSGVEGYVGGVTPGLSQDSSGGFSYV